MTDLNDRIPPQSVDTEREILGAMLIDQNAVAAGLLSLEP